MFLYISNLIKYQEKTSQEATHTSPLHWVRCAGHSFHWRLRGQERSASPLTAPRVLHRADVKTALLWPSPTPLQKSTAPQQTILLQGRKMEPNYLKRKICITKLVLYPRHSSIKKKQRNISKKTKCPSQSAACVALSPRSQKKNDPWAAGLSLPRTGSNSHPRHPQPKQPLSLRQHSEISWRTALLGKGTLKEASAGTDRRVGE